ncbi:MAG: response regulator transcription factor [Acidobacteriota bacterium]
MAERIKILLVDDDRSIRGLYNLGLPDEEFEKQFASNGKEALQTYATWHPDIVLLDIMLPELSGYSVLKTIRKANQDKLTSIIMATSISGKDDVLDCLKLGIQGYIVKPFKHTEIKEKVLEYFKRHRAQPDA